MTGVYVSAKINPLWNEYILWLATPEHERGAVSTEEEWAKSKGYSDARTMRRWKQSDEFKDLQKSLTESMVVKSGASLIYSDDETMDADERDYRLVKIKLVHSAKDGNLKAQELYMKTYGKTWVDEELAARSTDYSNAELPDLIIKAIESLDKDVLISTLTTLGYEVIKK